MSKIFPKCPKCPKCGQREWSVKRREETLSVASTHDIDGPFQNEEIIDSDLMSLRFFCASGECPVEDEAPDSLRDRLETAYYAAINRT